MTPREIAQLQKALGVTPTGTLTQDTLDAMRHQAKQAGLRTHAGREFQADLSRVGEATSPEGAFVSREVNQPPKPQVLATGGVEATVVPEPPPKEDIFGWYEPAKKPGQTSGGDARAMAELRREQLARMVREGSNPRMPEQSRAGVVKMPGAVRRRESHSVIEGEDRVRPVESRSVVEGSAPMDAEVSLPGPHSHRGRETEKFMDAQAMFVPPDDGGFVVDPPAYQTRVDRVEMTGDERAEYQRLLRKLSGGR
jgi:hypothetical protein